MESAVPRPDANLEILRGELAGHLALTLMALGVAWSCLIWPNAAIPVTLSVPVGLGLIGTGWAARATLAWRPAWGRRLLVGALALAQLAGMALAPLDWLPFLAPVIIFIAATLVNRGAWLIAAGVVALAAALTWAGLRAYPLLELALALAFSTALAWQTARTIYTAQAWAWNSQQQADQRLREARDYQAELARVLKSLDANNQVLRRTQSELITARQRAEAAQLTKSRFVANVSHELTTPLSLIVGFSEVMHLNPEVYGEWPWPATLRRDISQIYRSSRHLLGLLDDVFEASRFDLVSFPLNKEPTELEPLLRDTVEFARDLFQGRPIELGLDTDPGLPTLVIDQTRIRQVLLNLLNNARHFTEAGQVRVTARRAGAEVLISVQDTGPGIPADKLPHLFEEFYQVDASLRRQHGGAGLGLAICQRFVTAHGGRIWAESEVGAGATFCFTLPLAGAAPRLDYQPVEPRLPTRRPGLVVLDLDPRVPHLLRRHLPDYDVVQVTESGQLEAAVAALHPRAVIYNASSGAGALPPLSAAVPVLTCALPGQALTGPAWLAKPITAAGLLAELGRHGAIQRLLVVDTDRGLGQLIERLLAAHGQAAEVRRAYDAEEGLALCQAWQPDLTLVEADLAPGLAGGRPTPDRPVVVMLDPAVRENNPEAGSEGLSARRAGGLSAAEVLACLRGLLEILEPRYAEAEAAAPVL